MSSTAMPTRELPFVVFDGDCSFCRRQERRIRRLDWLGRLDAVPYDDAVQVWPEVDRGALGDGLRVRFPDGSVRVGVEAMRSIAIRLPLTALPALLLWLPGFRNLADAGYRHLARRRRSEAPSRRGDGSCSR